MSEHELLRRRLNCASVEFNARKCCGATAEWVNESIWSASDALDYAYCATDPNDERSQSSIETHRLLADRYGGPAIGFHGGSARCGTIGGVQVKGVGRTPLLTTRPDATLDRWHYSGVLDILEASREAIWSQICQSVLPHGAVPALAVIRCDENILSTDASPEGTVKRSHRALLLRSPAWRPSHFLRNLHFISGEKFHSWELDRIRTAEAIQTLPEIFRDIFGTQSGTVAEALNFGLAELSRRYAQQASAAFTKRIFHGALGPSNIALDGSYLDFGTMSFVPGFRRRTGAPAPDGPDFWLQHEGLTLTLRLLRRHVVKYHFETSEASIISERELLSVFSTELDGCNLIGFLKLLGADDEFISRYPKKDAQRVIRCLVGLMSIGALEPFTWLGEDDPAATGLTPIRSTGRYNLNDVIANSVHPFSGESIIVDSQPHLNNRSLSKEFDSAVGCFLLDLLHSQPQQVTLQAQGDLIRKVKLRNSDLSFLTREALDSSARGILEEGRSLSSFIEETSRRAIEIMRY